MKMKVIMVSSLIGAALLLPSAPPSSFALSDAYKDNVYETGNLKPTDSVLKVKAGDEAPDFKLPSVSGEWVSLGSQGEKECGDLLCPGRLGRDLFDRARYNIVKEMFEARRILLGNHVDNIPTLFPDDSDGNLWFSRPVRFCRTCGREQFACCAPDARRNGPVSDRQKGRDPLYRCP